MSQQRVEDLVVAICRCSEVGRALAESDHPCRTVVLAQTEANLTRRQVPEPWNGHLATAPILFISSNPGISRSEVFPDGGWSDAELLDYFDARFEEREERPPWIRQGTQTLQKSEHATQPSYSIAVQFLSRIRARASELLGRTANPGVDYALTEIVHCKSPNEAHRVNRAAWRCADMWLDRVLAASGAKVVVSVGAIARRALQTRTGAPPKTQLLGPIKLGGHNRMVLFIAHPNARGQKKRLGKLLDPAALTTLRQALQ